MKQEGDGRGDRPGCGDRAAAHPATAFTDWNPTVSTQNLAPVDLSFGRKPDSVTDGTGKMYFAAGDDVLLDMAADGELCWPVASPIASPSAMSCVTLGCRPMKPCLKRFDRCHVLLLKLEAVVAAQFTGASHSGADRAGICRDGSARDRTARRPLLPRGGRLRSPDFDTALCQDTS